MARRFRISGLFPSLPSPLGDSPALSIGRDVTGRIVSVLANFIKCFRFILHPSSFSLWFRASREFTTAASPLIHRLGGMPHTSRKSRA